MSQPQRSVLGSSEAKKNQNQFDLQENEERKKVYELFTYVAPKYDTMNDVFSLGLHRIWRNAMISRLALSDNMKIIDMAGGTGDIAFRLLDYTKKHNIKNCHVTVCDINDDMLAMGRNKIHHQSLESCISWVKDDAEGLSFEDESFEAYVVAFGVRNCAHRDKVLKEAHRILKTGGQFVCLEFSHVQNSVWRWFYNVYAYYVLPFLGHVLFRNNTVYEHLIKSVEEFPDQEMFKRMIEETGFKDVKFEDLLFGSASIHCGFKY